MSSALRLDLVADAILRVATADPIAARREMDRVRAQESLSDYAALLWHVLEPKRAVVRDRSWDAICRHLEAISRGEIRRLVINVPPGFSKSLLTNVFFPTWEWGPRNMPSLRYLSFSYAANLTIRDNRRSRQVITSKLYQQLWGDRFSLVTDQNAKVRFDNDHTGFRFATSVRGTGTGERGDRLLIDDPNNVKESESERKIHETNHWFSEVLPTRLNDPGVSAIIVIQQRTAEADVTGRILKTEQGYEWLCLPMEFEGWSSYTPVPVPGRKPERVRRCIVTEEPVPVWVAESAELPQGTEKAGPVRELYRQDWRTVNGELLAPERVPRDYLEGELKPQLSAEGGDYAIASQLQQSPTPRAGGMFKRALFQVIDQADVPAEVRHVLVRGFDLAASTGPGSAWSAGVKVGCSRGRTYVVDVDRIKGLPGDVEEWIVSLAKADGPSVWIDLPQDPGQSGKSQVAHLAATIARESPGTVVQSSPETGDKTERARSVAAQVGRSTVYVVRAAWTDAFLAEAARFPRGEFKDQIDALSRAYARAMTRLPPRDPAAAVVVSK